MSKPLSEQDREELLKSIDEEKAIPDMYFKRCIFESLNNMIQASSIMNFNHLKNAGIYSPLDVYRFHSTVMSLFSYIGEMILHNKILNLPPELDKKYVKLKSGNDYDLCLKIGQGDFVSEKELIRASAFLKHCAHRLNLTNLLQNNVGKDVPIEWF
jgi:hypothetical protein